MKFGIISDIHSNIYALEAILNEFNNLKIDKIICCGDIVGFNPFPEESTKLLMKYKDKLIAVRGNHEKYLMDGMPKYVHDCQRKVSENAIAHHKWNHSNLSKESVEFLSNFPLDTTLTVGNKKVYIVHYPYNEDGSFKTYVRNPSLEENTELFSNIDADIFIYGHTHELVINKSNNKMYINPGSLGCPFGTDYTIAGILTIEDDCTQFNQLKIKYDVQKLVKKIKELKYPDYEKVLKIFF